MELITEDPENLALELGEIMDAIELVKREVVWHKKHFKEGPSLEYEVAFIAGLEHILELLLRTTDSTQADAQLQNQAHK